MNQKRLPGLGLKITLPTSGLSVQAKAPIEQRPPPPSTVVTGKTFDSVYTLGSILGQGCASVVKCGTDKSHQRVAIKIIKSKDPEKIVSQIVEFRIMHRLNNENIIKTYELYIDEVKAKTFMVMEFFDGDTLGECVRRHHGAIPEPIAANLFRRILDALAYLHSKQVAHRDIHPDNILVNYDCNKIKVIDFNVAKYYGPSQRTRAAGTHKHTMMTQTGMIFFRSPEILSGGSYNEKVDLWSAGLCLYQMLHGTNPFTKETTESAILEKILKGDIEYSPEISLEVKDLLRKLLEINPSKRLSARDALDHPWLLSCKFDIPLKMNRSLSQVARKFGNTSQWQTLREMEEEDSPRVTVRGRIGLIHENSKESDSISPLLLQKKLMEIPIKKEDDEEAPTTTSTSAISNKDEKIETPVPNQPAAQLEKNSISNPSTSNVSPPTPPPNGMTKSEIFVPKKLGSETDLALKARFKKNPRPGSYDCAATKLATLEPDMVIEDKIAKDVQPDKKVSKSYLDYMKIFVTTDNAERSEIIDMLGYYKGYFEELQNIQRDRSHSTDKISPDRRRRNRNKDN